MSEKTGPRTKTIRTDYLARVEGEGGMLVRMRGGKVTDVQLKIYEPPRFFEAFLRGRDFTEAPDMTARICGICPVAYQMSSCLAMESLAGVEVDGQLRALRRLLYCGEWIESHTLHVFMLHAPDFLGVASAVELAKINPALVETALRLKKIGNEVMRVVGGREVHPINVRVGGWYKAPTRAQLEALVPDLEWAREAALEAVRVVAGLDFPDLEQDYELVALDADGEYPIDRGGRLVSNRGLDIPIADVLRPRRRGARRALERAPRHGCASAARTSSARSPATRSTATCSRRSRARPPTRPGSSRSSATRSARSSSAPSSSCTPATRRCA